MSAEIWVRFDIRGGGKAVSTAELCEASIGQAVWAERNGIDAVLLSEHHGTEDGYLPSPIVLAAAIAARTKSIRIHLALVLPIHDPLRLAEDICVLDNISNGRIDITACLGYVASEFTMFNAEIKQRVALMEEAIAVMRGAFSGKHFEYRGRDVYISPGPAQPDGPPIFIGGAVKASALRAARIGDGFNPPVTNPEFLDCYRTECKRLGRPVGRIIDSGGPLSIHVSRDPERDWPRVGQYMLDELNAYSKWSSESGIVSPFNAVKDSVEALKASGLYLVLTPDQCVDFFNVQMAKNQDTHITPLCGGLPPDIAWKSLELLSSEVLPRIKK